MLKSDLVAAVADRCELPLAQAGRVVDELFSTMTAALVRGDRVEVRGVGTFEVRHYGAYSGRNPLTGEPVAVRPKRLPFFKAGQEIRARLKGGVGLAERT